MAVEEIIGGGCGGEKMRRKCRNEKVSIYSRNDSMTII